MSNQTLGQMPFLRWRARWGSTTTAIAACRTARFSSWIADRLGVMTPQSLPPAFALLETEPNAAADAVLIDAIPSLSPAHRRAALDLLLRRAQVAGLARLVGRYHAFDDATRALISRHAGDLAIGLRAAIKSPELQDQSNAVKLIADSQESRTAYLLIDALRYGHASTRQLAVDALCALTDRLVATGAPSKQLDQLGESLSEAIEAWESHEQPRILEAAIRLDGRTETAIRHKLEGHRSTIGRALHQVLTSASDPAMAGFVLRALSVPQLRRGAVRAISSTQDMRFLTAILSECWLLMDPTISQGCHWIRIGPWCQRLLDLLPELDAGTAAGAVRLLMAAGGPPNQKEDLLTEMIGLSCDEVRRAVVWQLIGRTDKTSTQMLTLIASRPGDMVAGTAAREVQRRRRRLDATEPKQPPTANGVPHDTFEDCWNALDGLCRDQAPHIPRTLREHFPNIATLISERMSSSQPFDRTRALRLASACGLASDLNEGVQSLVHDPDPLVRSAAVGLLDRLPGRTPHRLIRLAVSDPDERVQANAIEVLDRQDADDRAALTQPKLASSNGRVRANAIKSLLRLEVSDAGESLMEMLDDKTVAHRISALWVIERLELCAAGHRIEDLAQTDPSLRVRRRAARVSTALRGSPGVATSRAYGAPVEPVTSTPGAYR